METERIPGKDRRKELILVAYEHIAKRGFEGLRVRDVAMEVGINNATLHYYFPTKESLIKGVVDTMIEKFSTPVTPEPVLHASPDALTELIIELEDARRRFHDARDQLIVFTELLIRSLRDPSIQQIFEKLDESWRGYLVSIIEKGIREGVFRSELDPIVAATLIMIQIKGYGFHMLGEKDQAIEDEVFEQLANQIESWLLGKF